MRLFQSLLEGVTISTTYLASRILALISWILGNKTLWSGLIPTALLAIVAYWALQRTGDQIEILREQISYVREPVLVVYLRALDGPYHPMNPPMLYLANIGSDTVENVDVRVRLLLMNETAIYSFGPLSDERITLVGRVQWTPKERQLPRLTLAPNEEKVLWSEIYMSLLPSYRIPAPKGDSFMYDLRSLEKQLEGQCVLFVQCLYRRKTDFAPCAETTWLYYDTGFGLHKKLKSIIGGPKVIRRATDYLRDGPEMSIVIQESEYVVWRSSLGATPIMVKRLPRQ